jgi:DNA-binding XRE family transcriptional regulator
MLGGRIRLARIRRGLTIVELADRTGINRNTLNALELNVRLWLDKFREKNDRFSLQRVEHATLELARRCGINVCHSRLETVGGAML